MISVATDCSGMEAPIQALMNLGVPFRHVFSCERDQACQETIKANYHPERLYDDMTTRDIKTLPPMDIYVCGFPCQPFSNAGKRHGVEDEQGRGHLFWYCLEVIQSKRPSLFILENVKGLCTIDNGHTFEVILDELDALNSYTIHWNVLNTKDYGIPQQRERLFIIGIHNRVKKPFDWPEPIPCQSLSRFIDRTARHVEPVPDFVLRSHLLERIPKRSLFIDIGFPKSNFINSDTYCPCITTQGNLWCVPMQRHATVKEHLSLQGFPDTFRQVVSDRQLKKQIGNSMSVNVLEAIFHQLLS